MKTRFLISVFSFLLSAFVWATGGVGFVNLCTPANIGSLQGWWKANTYTVADGTAVGGTGKLWIDQSGNGKDGAQATVALQPVFHVNVFGSAPGIQFTADSALTIQQFLDISAGNVANSITTSGDVTVFAVHISNATSATGSHSCIGGNAYAGGTGVNTIRESSQAFGFEDEGVIDNDGSATVATALNNPMLGVWGSKASVAFFYENAINRTSGSPAYGTFKFSHIGARTGSTPIRLRGYLGELVIMFKAVTTSQVQTLYGSYFRPRFYLP